MAQEIKFGTDGWRGIIADDFTFDNVRRVAGAIASYVVKYEDAQRGVFVGYDTRFASERFAHVAAEAVAATGTPVWLSETACPTPAVSLLVRQRGAAAGIQISASHNPYKWNGVKLKASYGSSASTAASLRNAMSQNPHLRVMIASGYYDLATPYRAVEHTLAGLGLDPSLRKNIAVEYYEAGHMMYPMSLP